MSFPASGISICRIKVNNQAGRVSGMMVPRHCRLPGRKGSHEALEVNNGSSLCGHKCAERGNGLREGWASKIMVREGKGEVVLESGGRALDALSEVLGRH